MADKIYDGKFIGTVIKVDKENRRAGVFIPKLMETMYSADAQEYRYATNNGLQLSNINTAISNVIEKKNYIWIKARDIAEPLPDIGSKVLIEFVDNNPRLGYYRPWGPNGDYKVIEEEKYPEVFKLKINAERDIKKEYLVDVKFPDYFVGTASVDDDEHKITYNINENFDFYKGNNLTNVIRNLQKSVAFVEKKYMTEFLTALKDNLLFEETPHNENYWIDHTSTYTLDENNEKVLNQVEHRHYYFKVNALRDVNNNLLDIHNLTVQDMIDLLNNFDYFAYPVHNYEQIQSIIYEYKDKLSKASTAKDGVDILTDLENTLSQFALTVETDTFKTFTKIKSYGINKVRETENLLDANSEYSYYNKLLTGLKDTYSLYLRYRSNYEKLTDEEKAAINQLINIYIIDDNIRLVFSRALGTSNKNTIDKYLHYIKSIFRTKPLINYQYSRDGQTLESSIVKSTHLFKHLSTSDFMTTIDDMELDMRKLRRKDMLSIDFKDYDRNINLFPVINNFDISKSAFNVVDWVDDTDRSILDPDYILIKSIDVTPKFIGMYIEFVNNTLNFNVVNNNNLEYKLYIGNVEKTLDEVKEYVLANGMSRSFKIKLEYPSMEVDKETNTKRIRKLEIAIDYTSDEYVNAINNLIVELGTVTEDDVELYKSRIDYINNLYSLMDTNKLPQQSITIMENVLSMYNTKFVAKFAEIFDQYKTDKSYFNTIKTEYLALTTAQQEQFKSGLSNSDLNLLNKILQ